MKGNSHRKSTGAATSLPGLTVVAVVLILVSVPSHGAKAPAGKTYFAVLVGMETPYSSHADCVKFTKTQMCFSNGTCGPWSQTDNDGPGTTFRFEVRHEDDAGGVLIKGEAGIEDRGKKDTLGGVAMAKAGRKKFNFALTGRSTSSRNCKRLLGQWDRVGSPSEAVLD